MGVLEHLAARFGAPAAFFGAFHHVLVVLVLFASGGTLVARFGASLANDGHHGAVTGGDRSSDAADIRAVSTKSHRIDVLLVPVGDNVGAMPLTRFTFQLTRRTGLGALLAVAVMVVGVLLLLCLLLLRLDNGIGPSSDRRQGSKYVSTIHVSVP
jgi:hypothetical protein